MNEKKSPPEYIILRDHENYCYVIENPGAANANQAGVLSLSCEPS
jgi:hypothetical protein